MVVSFVADWDSDGEEAFQGLGRPAVPGGIRVENQSVHLSDEQEGERKKKISFYLSSLDTEYAT